MKNPGIYILTNKINGMQYVGKDSRLPSRANQHLRGQEPSCPDIHGAIKEFGRDAFSVEIIPYPNISQEALNAVECWKITQLHTLSPHGYNRTEGGEGSSHCEETRQKISEINQKRVVDGTHPFLGGEINRKRVTDGTHHFLGGELQRRTNQKRVADGTHHFLDSEFQRRTNQKRVVDGTHHFLGGEINRKRVVDGTHHFLDGGLQRRTQKKRIEDGTHHFLDGEISRRTQKKRVDDGTHNFLDSEFQRQVQKKRIDEGTHHFLGENHPMRKLAKEGKHPRTIKRRKAEWCYIIALSRFWYEIHDYTLKRREEFLSKDILDMSNAEQEHLF